MFLNIEIYGFLFIFSIAFYSRVRYNIASDIARKEEWADKAVKKQFFN
jgi:hypothetical protein